MATSGFFNTPDFAALNPGYLLHFDPDEINIQRSRGGQRLGHTSLEIFGLCEKRCFASSVCHGLFAGLQRGKLLGPHP
jgi:hypothetical protein